VAAAAAPAAAFASLAASAPALAAQVRLLSQPWGWLRSWSVCRLVQRRQSLERGGSGHAPPCQRPLTRASLSASPGAGPGGRRGERARRDCRRPVHPHPGCVRRRSSQPASLPLTLPPPVSFLLILYVKSAAEGNQSGGFSQEYYDKSYKDGTFLVQRRGASRPSSISPSFPLFLFLQATRRPSKC